MKTIMLFSSSRRHGNTGMLADRIAKKLDIEIIDLSAKEIAPYDYGHGNRGDDFESVMEKVLEADNLIFASPVYWYAMCPPMKCFLDRITDYLDLAELKDRGRRLRGKTGYVLCTSSGMEVDPTFMRIFEKTFAYLGMGNGGYIHAGCASGFNAQALDGEVMQFLGKIR